ncbi:glycosyltransferase [Kocuria sp. SM24M-10]|uniref:glycosyltransferase n=1 Tax=Kocuria sp. SM24M-10 TaxID=1660349 RepID=UPI0006496E95|nr:glycosyltransferase [Kocuria sp. SM24M-10]KLU10380.1 hypothetical protein ABL57_06785 [Kocuria sp. SM24M-10]
MTEALDHSVRHVLLPAYTVADWGGLHENVLFAAKACLHAGLAVTAVARPGQFADALRTAGAAVVEVDWAAWRNTVPQIVDGGPYDVIYTQPFTSRELSLEVSRRTGAPVVAMFHGFNHDYVYMWHDKVEAIGVTAEVLRDFLVDFCRVPAKKITVVPNGIPNERFDAAMPARQEKIADGQLHILLASRLTPDKRSQMDVLRRLAEPLTAAHPDLQVVVDVLGGGPEELRIRSVLDDLEQAFPNVQGQMHGWVDAAVLPEFLKRSYLSITAGRAGLQSMVAGTPTIAAGARGIVGPAWGENRAAAIASNFGDYPIRGGSEWSYDRLFRDLADADRYSSIQEESRRALHDRMQSAIDARVLQVLTGRHHACE